MHIHADQEQLPICTLHQYLTRAGIEPARNVRSQSLKNCDYRAV